MLHQTHLLNPAAIDPPELGRLETPPATLLDIERLRRAVRNQKKLITTTAFAALLAAIILVLAATPQYTATTQILIAPGDFRLVGNGPAPDNQLSDLAVLEMQSQLRALTSDNVLRRVIASEKLEADQEFAGIASSHWGAAISAVAKPLGIALFAGWTDPTLTALSELRERIRVERAERTHVVDVSVTTAEPAKSARIANALARAYLAHQTASRSDASRQVSGSLAARMNELKERVRTAEQRVAELRARNNIVGASGELVNEQQVGALNNQLSLARSRSAEAKSRFDQLQSLRRSGADVGAFTEAVQSQTMAALREQYADVVRREAEQTTSLGDRHPAMIEIRAQAQRFRRLIAEELNRIAEAARSDYERARNSEEALSRRLEGLKRNTITNEPRIGLHELERDAQASRTAYADFLARSREIGEQERVDVRVISQADLPLRRSWPPSYALIAVAAMLLGASAGTGFALLREPNYPSSFTAAVTDAPAERSMELPLLAALPAIGAAHPLQAFEDPRSPAAAEIRKLHDTLRAGRKKWAGQSILMLSPDGAGAAAVAFNLALVAAANHSVLLIDAAIHRQGLAPLFPSNSAGLMDVASGQKLLSEAVVRDPQTNINTLPLVVQKKAYSGVEDQQIKAAFDQAKRYDLIIVLATTGEHDPIGSFFAGLVDHIVLIAAKGRKGQRALARAAAMLGTDAGKITGKVLTKAKIW